MSSSITGNFLSAVPSRPGFDVYCIDPQPTDPTPNIVVFSYTADSNSIERKVTFRAENGFRDSKIAVNRRELGSNTQQASVFYQGNNGNLLEYRINHTGARELHNVNNVPETMSRNPKAPSMGTSLASVVSGADNQTDFLFYQAEDKKIYYVWRKAFGSWSIPSLVTSHPTQSPTTLSAFSWTESDPNAATVVDCVCVAFNQFSSYVMVHMRRSLRLPLNGTTSSLEPYFELVASYDGLSTRGPFSGVHAGAPAGGYCSSSGRYLFYTQSSQDPPQILEGTVSPQSTGRLEYTAVVSDTTKLKTPARGSM